MAKLRFTMEYIEDDEQHVRKWGIIVPLIGKGEVKDITPDIIEQALTQFKLTIGSTDVKNWAK